jgi:hypothetical protein
MADTDVLHFVSEDGAKQEPLDAADGITYIGLDKNDKLVAKTDEIKEFLAAVDHRVYPRQLVVFDERYPVYVDAERVSVEQPFVLTHNDVIQLRGSHVVYLAAPARASWDMFAGDVTTDEPPTLEDVLDDTSDPKIGASLERRHFSAPAGEWLEIPVTVTNLGELEASFEVKAEGPPYVEFSQAQSARLHAAGGAQTVVIYIRPERVSANTANERRPFWILVRSPDHYPKRVVRLAATLTVPPFAEFHVHCDKAGHRLWQWWRWRRDLPLHLTNDGNHDLSFEINQSVGDQSLDFVRPPDKSTNAAPSPAEVPIMAGETRTVHMRVRAREPRWLLWWGKSLDGGLDVTLADAPEAGAKTVPVALHSIAMFPLSIVLLLLLPLLLLLGIVIARQQWPRIEHFAFTQDNIRHGDATTLEWEGSPNTLFDIQSSDGSFSLIGQSSADGAIEIRPAVTSTTFTETTTFGTFVEKPRVIHTTFTVKAHNDLSRGPIGVALMSLPLPLQLPILGPIPILTPLLGPAFSVPTRTVTLTRGIDVVKEDERSARTCFQPGVLMTDPATNPPTVTVGLSGAVTLTRGESLTVRWTGYECIERLNLYNDSAVEVIPTAEIFEGQRILTPREGDQRKLITLEASGYGQSGVQRIDVNITDPPTPTPTPLPPPQILRFEVKPESINSGEQVIVEWEVTGVPTATLVMDGVQYDVDDMGAFSQRPYSFGEDARPYLLEATGEGGTSRQLRVLTIRMPTPTPTPEPEFLGKPDYDGYCRGEGKADLRYSALNDQWKWRWVCKEEPEIDITDKACEAQYVNGASGKAVANPRDKPSWECWRYQPKP